MSLFYMNFTLRNCNQNQRDMKKKNETPAKTTTVEKVKNFQGVLSTQPPPGDEELAQPLIEEPTLYDLNVMKSIRINEPEEKGKPIVFSKIWYEFSMFAKVIDTHPNTVAKWMRKGWLPYSQIGKLRYINLADVEAMMLRFRRPALLWLGY